MKPKIILASASKRRSRILTECGIPHTIRVSNAQEIMQQSKGMHYTARTNAAIKAKAISRYYRSAYIIGADTVVALGKRLIGKPATFKEAQELLRSFSGKLLRVYTGLCVINSKTGKTVTDVAVSRIHVKKIRPKDFGKLIQLLGSYDKAGGFSIEGVGTFIFDDIEGSFYNILGLPMITLSDLFRKLGVNLLDYIKN